MTESPVAAVLWQKIRQTDAACFPARSENGEPLSKSELKKRQKAEEKERLKAEKAKKIAEKEAAEKAAKNQAEEVSLEVLSPPSRRPLTVPWICRTTRRTATDSSRSTTRQSALVRNQ